MIKSGSSRWLVWAGSETRDNLLADEVCSGHIISFITTIIIILMYVSISIVKLRSLDSQTEWSNMSERNQKLIVNLKKGPELILNFQIHYPPTPQLSKTDILDICLLSRGPDHVQVNSRRPQGLNKL